MTVALAIRGGTVVDGSGAPPVRADVGITDGRVAEIEPRVSGRHEIDASGKLVVPGFIDIHTHYDPQVLWDPWLTPSSWHGVTSVVAGNCGYSIAPARPESRDSLCRTLDKVEDMRFETLAAGIRWEFETYPQYLDFVRRRGIAINFGGYVGHTAVRIYVLGDDAYERVATDDEVDRMRDVVRQSLLGGALGFSSDRAGFHVGDGGRRVPSIVADQSEVESLMRVTAEIGRGIVHIAPGEQYAWVYAFQRSLGRPITWSAILTYPADTKSKAPYGDKLEAHAEGRRAGSDVWAQVTCRPIVQSICMAEPTSLYLVPAFSEFVAAGPDRRRALYADHAWRDLTSAQLDGGKYVNPRWETFTVGESAAHPELTGSSVAQLARERGVSAFAVVCDLALRDDLRTRFNVTFANDEADGVSRLLTSEGCVLGLSDAGAHVGQICDAVLPTDFLSGWVRDRELMAVEHGVRKLTGELADLLGIDRGYLRIGAPADVVVLDWERLSPGPTRRVHDMPANGERLIADAPVGIDAIVVNGVPIASYGKQVVAEPNELPGTTLQARSA